MRKRKSHISTLDTNSVILEDGVWKNLVFQSYSQENSKQIDECSKFLGFGKFSSIFMYFLSFCEFYWVFLEHSKKSEKWFFVTLVFDALLEDMCEIAQEEYDGDATSMDEKGKIKMLNKLSKNQKTEQYFKQSSKSLSFSKLFL